MRRQILPLLFISVLFPLMVRAQTADQKKEHAALLATHKDLAPRLSAWSEQTLRLQLKLERSASSTQQALARRLKLALDPTVRADIESTKLLALFPRAKPANIRDLDELVVQATACSEHLGDTLRQLRHELGVRDQRIAFEGLLQACGELARDQAVRNREDALKHQARLLENTKQLTALLNNEGKGDGKLGKHLAFALAELDGAVRAQTLIVQQTKLLRDAQEEADRALQRAAREIEDVVVLLRVREHRSIIKDVALEMDVLRKTGDQVLDYLDRLAEAIAKNPDRKPMRMQQADCLRLADAIGQTVKKLDALSNRVRASDKANVVADLIAGTSADLRRMTRELEKFDTSATTLELGRRSFKALEATRAILLELDKALTNANPGSLGDPVPLELPALISDLVALETAYRRFTMDLVRYRAASVDGLLPELKRE